MSISAVTYSAVKVHLFCYLRDIRFYFFFNLLNENHSTNFTVYCLRFNLLLTKSKPYLCLLRANRHVICFKYWFNHAKSPRVFRISCAKVRNKYPHIISWPLMFVILKNNLSNIFLLCVTYWYKKHLKGVLVYCHRLFSTYSATTLRGLQEQNF